MGCMTEEHATAFRAAGVAEDRVVVINGETGGVPDPIGQSDAVYLQTANVLQVFVKPFLDKGKF
eukprot:NODE_10647_length_236_cov_14.208556_g9906_i0.p3 GENE.NODE_10647_length_236_cov_14.208556_g9906_i0~~NODE_10647_length_236_cov_14.208556_g9906_i0.p3  ORF type:complete len:64 (-),score=20.02 NODE_10647_length_236_cov_14.208556_g9906_i0:15-206(-)